MHSKPMNCMYSSQASYNLTKSKTMAQFRSKIGSKLRIRNKATRNFLSEFLGTFILMIFGNASGAVAYFNKENAAGMVFVPIAWGLGLMVAICISGGISGAHLNPAVTLTYAILGRVSWVQVPVYFLAQYFGAFTASATIYGIYYDAFNKFLEKDYKSAAIFATFPQPFVGIPNSFADEVLSTALLLLGIMAITDSSNMTILKNLYPLYIGALLIAILYTFGYNCGAALNPARDMGPRIFLVLAGWNPSEVFMPYGGSYWWIPIIGSHIGAILGAGVYLLFIGLHLERDEDESGVLPIKDHGVSTIAAERRAQQ